MKKPFEIEDLNCMSALVGKKFDSIFYQPVQNILSDDNMFVINFENKKYSLHSFCFTRIIRKDSILLTSSDEYFDKNYNKLDIEIYEENLQNEFRDSLVSKSCEAVRNFLYNAKVESVLINDVADITIKMDNDALIEIRPDCLYNNYEYYRFINEHAHHIVCFENGQLVSAMEKPSISITV